MIASIWGGDITLRKKLKKIKFFLANTHNPKSGRLVAQADVIQKMVLNINNPRQSNKHRSPIISPNSAHIHVEYRLLRFAIQMTTWQQIPFNLFILIDSFSVGNIVTVAQDVWRGDVWSCMQMSSRTLVRARCSWQQQWRVHLCRTNCSWLLWGSRN